MAKKKARKGFTWVKFECPDHTLANLKQGAEMTKMTLEQFIPVCIERMSAIVQAKFNLAAQNRVYIQPAPGAKQPGPDGVLRPIPPGTRFAVEPGWVVKLDGEGGFKVEWAEANQPQAPGSH